MPQRPRRPGQMPESRVAPSAAPFRELVGQALAIESGRDVVPHAVVLGDDNR